MWVVLHKIVGSYSIYGTLLFGTKIEFVFEILKNRFKVLSVKPHHPFPSPVNIVLACTVLHNYISIVDPYSKFINEKVILQEEHGDIIYVDDNTIENLSINMKIK